MREKKKGRESPVINVRLDASALLDAIDLLDNGFAGLEARKHAFQILFNFINSGEEFIEIDSRYSTAGGTTDLIIFLKPSNRFRDFIAAALAGNLNSFVINV